jgi:hypothetical protein
MMVDEYSLERNPLAAELLARNAELYAGLRRFVDDGPRLDEAGCCVHCGADENLGDPICHDIDCTWGHGSFLAEGGRYGPSRGEIGTGILQRARLALTSSGLPELKPDRAEGFRISGVRAGDRYWLRVHWVIPGSTSGAAYHPRRARMAEAMADVIEGIGLVVNREPYPGSRAVILAGETPEDVET